MANAFTQVPPNSTGNKMRTRTRMIGPDEVHEQAVFQGALPTFYALADNVAFAANKQHISIFNAPGSGKVISIRKLFMVNVQLAAVTGVVVRFDAKRTTAQSGGTAIVPNACDTTSASLAGIVTIATGATVTEGPILYPIVTNTDEVAAGNTQVSNFLMQYGSLALEGAEQQELRIRVGEGFTVKQITSTTVGTYSWLVVFTVDDA